MIAAGTASRPGSSGRSYAESWLGSGRRSQRDLARDTAQAVRQLSEGQEAHTSGAPGAWSAVLSILGALFLIQMLFGLGAFVFSLFMH